MKKTYIAPELKVASVGEELPMCVSTFDTKVTSQDEMYSRDRDMEEDEYGNLW